MYMPILPWQAASTRALGYLVNCLAQAVWLEISMPEVLQRGFDGIQRISNMLMRVTASTNLIASSLHLSTDQPGRSVRQRSQRQCPSDRP
eukprot:7815289-Pyramimonas_sp.AAC.1